MAAAPSLVWVALAGLVTLVAVKLYQRDQRLAQFPGPLLARFSDFWQLWFMYKDRPNEPYRQLHERYGKVVRMAPNKLYFSDPAAIRDIYGLRKDLRKSKYYNVSAPVADGYPVMNFFASTDPHYHDTIRRSIQQYFNMSSLVQYEPAVDKIIALFIDTVIKRFADKPGSKCVLNLPRWIHYFSLDTVSNVTYSQPYGFIEADKDLHGMIKDIEESLNYQVYVGQAPWIDKLLVKNPLKLYLNRLGLFNHVSPPVPLAAMAQGARLSAVKTLEADPEKPYNKTTDGTGHSDLLDKLVRVQGEHPSLMNNTEILKIGLAVVFAGADSTAASLTAILYYLLKTPDKLARLRADLDAQVYSRLPEGETPTFATLSRVPYLDACVKEAMRRFAVIRFTPERVSPSPGGTHIAGHHVPAGVVVGANPWALHNNKDVFGEDVDAFRPERWLEPEASPERYREMSGTLMLFGHGKYSCIGQNISLMEMFKFVPEVVRRLDLGLVDGEAGEWRFKHGLFVNLEGLDVKIGVRKAGEKEREMNGRAVNGHVNGYAA